MSSSFKSPLPISAVNELDRESFVQLLGAVFENSPWIAQSAWDQRPFFSVEQLHHSLCDIVQSATESKQIALINAHPDLAGREAQANQLTAQSAQEQGSAGLKQLTLKQQRALQKGNAEYRSRFGFTFVICARLNEKEAILRSLEQRLQNSRAEEIQKALKEIFKIADLRLRDLVCDPRPAGITTHVLDTANGCPAKNMQIEFWRLSNGTRELLRTVRTNSDGRTDSPLAGSELQPGEYEIVFFVGEYFCTEESEPSKFPFLNRVPVCFGIADATARYHIPLLCSPWAYSTYRGS